MMEPMRIIFVSGGQRSGKSVLAEKIALSLSDRPVYIATARIYDDETRRRVDVHRQRRGDRWTTIEAPVSLDFGLTPGDVALMDCLTMFATNHFFDAGEDADVAYDAVVAQLELLLSRSDGATLVIVSNEIGLGGVPANAMQRHFTDLQGRLNQWVAARADEAWLSVSGLPLRLK